MFPLYMCTLFGALLNGEKKFPHVVFPFYICVLNIWDFVERRKKIATCVSFEALITEKKL